MDLGVATAAAPVFAPRSTTGIQALETLGALAELRVEWEALFARSDASIFNSWEWIYPWTARLSGKRPWALTAREADGALKGLWALGREDLSALGRSVRRVSFLGDARVGSDYLDVVVAPEDAEGTTRALVDAVARAAPTWDVLELHDLHEGSALLSALRAAFRDGFEFRVSPRHTCPFDILPAGEAFDAFLKRTGRRDNYRRRLKALNAMPGFRIEKTETPAGAPAALAEFFRLHRLRWSSDGGSQGIGSAAVEAFHRDAVELLAERGRVRMYTMWVGAKAVASVYGMLHDGAFIYYQAGYDPAWRDKSVGLVLIGETFKDALAEGRVEYDFLRGTETYKSDWTSRTRRTVSVRIFRRGGAGEWFDRVDHARLDCKRWAKAALPENALERFRRWRRTRAAKAS